MAKQYPKSVMFGSGRNSLEDAESGGGTNEPVRSGIEQSRLEAFFDGSQFCGPGQSPDNCPTASAFWLSEEMGGNNERVKSKTAPFPSHRINRLSRQQQVQDSTGAGNFYPFNERYLIGDKIGNGGMGLVYLGWDLQLKRCVAIKIIRQDKAGNDRNQSRFLREARVASRLCHPGILGIHDFGFGMSGEAYMIMDLIVGETLSKAIAEAVNCEAKKQSLLTSFFQICQAMAFAHANGVVHRDLKPANIMVGNFGLATVLDWGLAKVLDADVFHTSDLCEEPQLSLALQEFDESNADSPEDAKTLFGTVMGTPHYLAPEQARGEAVDYRSDVFSLGSILCHILTGSPPFNGQRISDVYRQSVEGDLSLAFELLDRCGAPIPLVRLAKQCLDPEVSSRPQNASFLVEELKEYLESGQRRAEEELVRFFDLSLDLFCIANTAGYFWRVNDNFTRTLGYSARELTTRPFIDFVHPDDRAGTLQELVRISKGEPTIQFVNRYRHQDGHYISLEWTARSLASEGVIYAVARDITERLQLENEKSRIECDRFRLAEIVDSACDAIIGKDVNGVVQSWNLGAEKLFGYTAEEMIGQPIQKIIPLERRGEERVILARIRGGVRVDTFETVRIHKSGERIDISLSISPIRDVSGAVIGASKIARSIAKQRELESDLEKSRKALVEFAENANVPLHCVDQTGTVVWANNAELNFLGYSREEYVGQPIAKFHANQETIADIFSQLVQGKALSHYPAKLVAKDGSVKNVAIYSSPYQENGKMVHTRCFTLDLNIASFGSW